MGRVRSVGVDGWKGGPWLVRGHAPLVVARRRMQMPATSLQYYADLFYANRNHCEPK